MKKYTKQQLTCMPYSDLVNLISSASYDEIVELSKVVGYPTFARLCMGELKHKYILLQDGAAAVIVNKKGQILLQFRADNEKWGLPGGRQELGETFEDTILREVKEETNLDVNKKDLKLLSVVSGMSRANHYPNGDQVINNTALFIIKRFSGDLKWNYESKDFRFFDIKCLPHNQNDPDLIEIYLNYIKENKNGK